MTTAGTPATLLRRALDGERTWGSLEISDGRYGMARYRLVVYPPGLRRDERIPLRLWRSFPIWGLALWLTIQVAMMAATAPGIAFALSTGVSVSAGVVVMAMAGRVRGEVRTLMVVRMTGIHDLAVLARHHEFNALALRLIRADARRDAGELTALEHEAEVWQVYDRIGAR